MSKDKNDIVKNPAPEEEKSSMKKPKLLIIGLPVFVVQLILVYFITANILIKNTQGSNQNPDAEEQVQAEEEQTSDSTSENNIGKSSANFIYNVDDVIINPANTNGKMLLLTSIGLDCEKEEVKKNLESKQIVVKDIIISVLSGKTVEQLSQMAYRDSIKIEITSRLKNQLPDAKINNVYFSKFIIQ